MNRLLLGSVLALAFAGSAAQASVQFDVALGMNLNEDSRIFLNVTNQTWHPAVASTVIQACPNPEDDFPVIAFLAYHSHRSPTFILNLRKEGYGWSDIFYQVNVQPSVLFVGIDRDPGPPYGKAWGYWRKHSEPGVRGRYRFSDRDVVGLVKVQTASRHLGASPYSIIEAQQSGRRPEAYTVERWRQNHGRETWVNAPPRGNGQGRGHHHDDDQDSQGHGNSHGHGHGHGGGHGNDNGDDRN
jgi:hypothetical protein